MYQKKDAEYKIFICFLCKGDFSKIIFLESRHFDDWRGPTIDEKSKTNDAEKKVRTK